MLKRALRAFIAFFFGHGIAIVGSLLLVPLYLHVWSAALYGEWLALYSLVAYLSSLDLGVQTYAVNRLTQVYARGNLEEYRQVQDTAFAFYTCLALLGGVGIVAFAWWAPIRSWFHVSLTSERAAFVIVVMLGEQFLWTMPASMLWSVYTTIGDLARTQWVTNVNRVLSLGLSIAALLLWPNLVVVAGAQVVGFLLVFGWVWWDVRKRYPDLTPGFTYARARMLRPILNQSIFFALIDLAVGATLQGSNFIVASLAGTEALALFVTTRTLANSIRQLVALFVQSCSTNLTQLEALEDRRRLRLAFRLVVFATVAGCLAVSASLWFEGGSVFSVWTRGQLVPDVWLLRTFLLWLVLQSPWIASSAIQMYTNKHRGLAVSYLVSSFGGLLLGLAIIPRFGLKGLPMAFILAEAVACYHFVVRNACRIIGESYLKFAGKLWGGMIVVSVSGLAATWAVHLMRLGPFTSWICSGVASVVAVSISTWVFWFHDEERALLRRKVGSGAKLVGRSLPLSLRVTNSG